MAATLLCVYITSQLAELQIKWNSRRRNSDCCVRFLVSSIVVKKAGIQHTTQPRMMKKAFYIFIYIVVVCNRTYIHTAPELLLLVLCIVRFCSSMPTLLYTSTGIQQCYRSMLWYTRPTQSRKFTSLASYNYTLILHSSAPHTSYMLGSSMQLYYSIDTNRGKNSENPGKYTSFFSLSSSLHSK